MTLLNIAGILLACFIIEGSSIQCFDCVYRSVKNASVGIGCNKPVNASNLVTCSTDKKYCKTSIQFTAAVKRYVVIRSCSAEKSTETECFKNVIVTLCASTCSADGCNNGTDFVAGHSGGVKRLVDKVTFFISLFAAMMLWIIK